MNEDGTALIPRRVLFGNSERNLAMVSHDGERLAFLAPVDGVMNVWVSPVNEIAEARAVTKDEERGISFYIWPYNANYILYLQDTEGDENWHLYATHLDSLETTDLTPYEAIHARVVALSPSYPDEILVGVNNRDTRLHDVHRVNMVSGESSLEFENDIGATWFVADEGLNFYLYERESNKLKYLFSNRPALEEYVLSPMHSTAITSRDGLDLTVYYTLPAWRDQEGSPPPAVLLVHGGPWGKDSWGFVPSHQLWANRGYSVISVNFRGSWGFGKAFVNAGNREWAGKMHDDLFDVVDWAAAEGIADREKIAIMGGSYGGYATLVGLTFTPDTFACGVDVVGPSNLNTLLDTVPPYWEPEIAMFRTRVGDNSTEEGRRFLAERSPLTFADRIVRPLLIGQGANDPRVKRAESDQIVEAMKAQGIPVTYVLFPDEGHGFRRPENHMAFMAIAEAFLARCLGGRCEPIGEDFEASSAKVVTDETEVPGLSGHLNLTC